MARAALPRSFVLTLFTGLCVLMAVYFAARYPQWDEWRRVTLLLAFVTLGGSVFFADWYLHRRRARD